MSTILRYAVTFFLLVAFFGGLSAEPAQAGGPPAQIIYDFGEGWILHNRGAEHILVSDDGFGVDRVFSWAAPADNQPEEVYNIPPVRYDHIDPKRGVALVVMPNENGYSLQVYSLITGVPLWDEAHSEINVVQQPEVYLRDGSITATTETGMVVLDTLSGEVRFNLDYSYDSATEVTEGTISNSDGIVLRKEAPEFYTLPSTISIITDIGPLGMIVRVQSTRRGEDTATTMMLIPDKGEAQVIVTTYEPNYSHYAYFVGDGYIRADYYDVEVQDDVSAVYEVTQDGTVVIVPGMERVLWNSWTTENGLTQFSINDKGESVVQFQSYDGRVTSSNTYKFTGKNMMVLPWGNLFYLGSSSREWAINIGDTFYKVIAFENSLYVYDSEGNNFGQPITRGPEIDSIRSFYPEGVVVRNEEGWRMVSYTGLDPVWENSEIFPDMLGYYGEDYRVFADEAGNFQVVRMADGEIMPTDLPG